MSPVQPEVFSRQAYRGLYRWRSVPHLVDHKINLHHVLVKDVMTADCKTIDSGRLAADVLQIMASARINATPAVNAGKELVGALDMHDLLRAGVV